MTNVDGQFHSSCLSMITSLITLDGKTLSVSASTVPDALRVLHDHARLVHYPVVRQRRLERSRQAQTSRCLREPHAIAYKAGGGEKMLCSELPCSKLSGKEQE